MLQGVLLNRLGLCLETGSPPKEIRHDHRPLEHRGQIWPQA